MNRYFKRCECKPKWIDSRDDTCFVCLGTGMSVNYDLDDIEDMIELVEFLVEKRMREKKMEGEG